MCSSDLVRDVMSAAQKVYRLYDAPERLEAIYPDAEHSFPTETRQRAYAFLDRFLRSTTRE